MKQAAAILTAEGIHCTVSTLKAIKASGSAAFAHGRVNLEMVREELKDLPEPPKDDEIESKEMLERRKLRAQWQTAEFRLEVEKKKYVAIEDVRRDHLRIGSATRSELSRFIGDLPNMAGLTAAEIFERGQKWLQEICENLSDETSKLYT